MEIGAGNSSQESLKVSHNLKGKSEHLTLAATTWI